MPKDQSERQGHVVYRVTLPANLQVGQVQAWLRSVGGQRRSSLGLELWATDLGLTHRLLVPAAQADYVTSQLRSLVPGAAVVPETSRIMPHWTAAVELALTDMTHTLLVPSAEELSTRLLASLQALRSGETVLWQLVITPAAPEKPPTKHAHGSSKNLITSLLSSDSAEADDQAAKLKEPNYLVVFRLAVKADDEDRACHLLDRVRSALIASSSLHTSFRKKLVFSKANLMKRIAAASGSRLYSAQFSITELSGLMAWPIGSPHVAGLPARRTRQLPATAAIPRTGKVIGHSNFPSNERPVAIAYQEATKHLHVIGPTGTGKTTLLANLVAQDMKHGYGVIVLESKGDLFHAVLERVPRRRIKDTVVLDVNDTDYPVGFNVLDSGTTRSAVDELSALITGLYGDHGGIYAPMLLYYGLHALAEIPGYTFIDLPNLLTPQGPEEVAWRDELVQGLRNREVCRFWERYLSDQNKERDRMAAPVHNRIWQLAVRPEIRNIIGQSRSSFTFEDVLRENKILLIHLNGVRVGEQTASITGTLLMNALWTAVRVVKKTKPSFLYLDEFQDFVNLPVNAADLLAKTRSFGLGMVLAHQDLDQLSKVRGLEQAVLANARTKVVYQTSARDARAMQREFGRMVDEDDFLHLGAYEALARIATADGVSAPITIQTEPPSRKTGVANAVRAASRTTYGRPIAEVEAEIDARRRPKAQSKKPKLGAQRWE
jgi:hypothetical protein